MKNNRIIQHIVFWGCFMLLYIIMNMLFPSPTDAKYTSLEQFFRFLFYEIVFLPWKIIPFYLLFYYLIPRYLDQKKHLKIIAFFLISIFFCALAYRSMIRPVSYALYGESPSFDVYSLKRIFHTIMEIIPAIGVAATTKLLKNRTINQKRLEALQAEKRIAELNFLKAQTNPHFLFNTLNNLYGLARKKDDNTANFIMKLSNIMRYILQECNNDVISIEKEIKIIEDYIELEKLRYDSRLKVIFNKEIEDDRTKIAPLILLPFVENAFKHGVSETRFETFIQIDLTLKNQSLVFNIRNTKTLEKTVLSEGVGLENISRQLNLIYGDKHQLDIDDSGEIFSINLQIQLIS